MSDNKTSSTSSDFSYDQIDRSLKQLEKKYKPNIGVETLISDIIFIPKTSKSSDGRIKAFLRRSGINTVGDLLKKCPDSNSLSNIHGIGPGFMPYVKNFITSLPTSIYLPLSLEDLINKRYDLIQDIDTLTKILNQLQSNPPQDPLEYTMLSQFREMRTVEDKERLMALIVNFRESDNNSLKSRAEELKDILETETNTVESQFEKLISRKGEKGDGSSECKQ